MKTKIIGSILFATMLAVTITPITAGAINSNGITASYSGYTVEQLEALIVKLQKQLEDLRKGAQCFVSDKNLSIGDGEEDGLTYDIKRLQDFLREKGYFQIKSTGFFGKITKSAVINFQNAQGVAQTGEFDQATREKAHTQFCNKITTANYTSQTAKETKTKNDTTSKITSISLSAGTNGKIAWTFSGQPTSGFKVVWSKNTGPTYPLRDGDTYLYLTDNSANSATLSAFSGTGTYYVRVCEYLGGVCGTYSNEISISL